MSYLVGGENARVKLKDISDEEIQPGYVLSPRGTDKACAAVRKFEAQLAIVELLEHKAIFSAGYTAVLHIAASAEVRAGAANENSRRPHPCASHLPPFALSTATLPSNCCSSECSVETQECSILRLTATIDKKSGARSKKASASITFAVPLNPFLHFLTLRPMHASPSRIKAPMFVKSGAVIACVIEVEQPVCIETFDSCPQARQPQLF